MPYAPNSYSYSIPSINDVLGPDWSANVGSLMDRGVAGAGTLLSQKYAGEGTLQDARLKNALELANLGYGSQASLQKNQLDTERALAAMGYGSAAELQKGQLGFGREQLRETGRQFDASQAQQQEAPMHAFNLQLLSQLMDDTNRRREAARPVILNPSLSEKVASSRLYPTAANYQYTFHK